MPYDDLFMFFRWVLSIFVTVYASIITLQSLYGWWIWLMGSDRYIGMIRRYVIVHGLRLRFKSFWGDVIICGLLCVIFLIMWHAHHVVADTGQVWSDVRHANAKIR